MSPEKTLAELEAIIAEQNNDPFGWVLSHIGGWHVGSEIDRDNAPRVREALALGYVTERMHYAPMIPEGVPAYELTDDGLEQVRERCGELAYQSAVEQRTWYRESAQRHKSTD